MDINLIKIKHSGGNNKKLLTYWVLVPKVKVIWPHNEEIENALYLLTSKKEIYIQSKTSQWMWMYLPSGLTKDIREAFWAILASKTHRLY